MHEKLELSILPQWNRKWNEIVREIIAAIDENTKYFI